MKDSKEKKKEESMIDKSEQIKRELPKKIFLWEYNKNYNL